MINGLFVTKLKSKTLIDIPNEIVNGLVLEEGDSIEVSIKKIRTKRIDIKISRNPLVKILDLKP